MSRTRWVDVVDGSDCDDGDSCTQVDTCRSGACVGSDPVVCTALDACHVAGVCDPASGACSNPDAPDGTPCDDGNACTATDSCLSGACVGSHPVTCTASDQCHVAGTCDALTGICTNPTAPSGTSCTTASGSGECQGGGLCLPLPVAYYPFSGNALDATGGGSDASVFGPLLTSDRNGAASSAYMFDGLDDYMTLANEPTFDLPRFTIALWVKLTTLPQPTASFGNLGYCVYSTLVTKAANSSPDYAGNFTLGLGKCGGASYTTLTFKETTSELGVGSAYDNTRIYLDQWRHIVVTHDGTTFKFYVDGSLRSSTPMAAPYLDDQPVRFGKSVPVASGTDIKQPFGGSMDEVRFYDRALSAEEVAAIP